MTTDEMLIEIVSYKYEAFGFSHVWIDYSHTFKVWSVIWRNPIKFNNETHTYGKTPNESCKKALKFIKDNPHIFTKN